MQSATGKAQGVLILSHVGFSFLEDLVEVLDARSLASYVLSSLPLPEHQLDRPREMREKADDVRVVARHELTEEDVEAYLADLRERGEDVVACVSVWEGYRHLMAHANAALGVPDLDPKQVLTLRDKLTVRNRLADAGLTRSRAAELTRESLAAHQGLERRQFVKPVSGIASYGAFPLSPGTTWDDIERIVREAGGDTVYASAFGDDGLTFLVEDYVEGQEFSFEVIADDGAVSVVAVHEKCEVTEAADTVLENACVSPPHAVGQDDLARGLAWVREVLAHFELRWGCFHIEARYDGSHWDLIEINPRVGGALISPSVRELTGQAGMLDLWTDALLAAAGGPSRRAAFRDRLAALAYAQDGSTPTRTATFFRVFFAEKGRIEHLGPREDLPLRPTVTQLLLKAGDVVDAAAREVFLGQLLWSFPREESTARLAELARTSAHALDVRYADATPDL
ncbi:ATP-grasp domain-containing protein [Streptomyces sp. NPDC006385]|uniref:ATP-grasp domain-containing protein n=1 Tax=Streptomyces sp. NPDC006385 TaxID=3156761 RepID=UPI00339EE8F5